MTKLAKKASFERRNFHFVWTKGEILVCFQIQLVPLQRGSALNAWIYPDPEDPTRIVSANIGRADMASSSAAAETTTPEDASFSFVNHPFKYTAGDEHPAVGAVQVECSMFDPELESAWFQTLNL
jgi:hypothetical protein